MVVQTSCSRPLSAYFLSRSWPQRRRCAHLGRTSQTQQAMANLVHACMRMCVYACTGIMYTMYYSMCIYIYIYVCIHVYIYIYIYDCIPILIHIYFASNLKSSTLLDVCVSSMRRAMLIFSVSFKLWRMIPEGNPPGTVF